ncbi:hypothetical protein M0811_00715 [Anaeramoeba ignava]|uniref:Uncharacterized protein n=1 Tax=Anaeramoeba ignava TaxID=1746090 RepID=A0A9Q0LJK0_ANAIG|nr:hypothetical protein M0811_00715 [Anaeramoeba ignava]
MVSTIELIKRTPRAASKTGSPQLYITSFISLFLALLFLYEIIRTIRITKSIWKNVTSRFRILVLSFSFIGLFTQTLTALISFNWESIFLIFLFYVNLVFWSQFSSYIAYIFYVVKTLQLIEGKRTKIRKYSDLIFAILIIITFGFLILFCYLDAKNLNDNTTFTDAYRFQNLYNIIWILPLNIIFAIISIKSYKKFGGYILVKIQKERIKYVAILTIIGSCFFGVSLFGLYLVKTNKNQKYLDLIFAILIIITFGFLILFCYLDAKNLNDNTTFTDAYRFQNLYNIIWILPLNIIFAIISIKSYKKFGGYILVKIQKERIKYVAILTIIGSCFFGASLIWAIFSVSGANKMSNNLKSYLENEEYSKFDNFNLFFHFIFFLIPSFIIFFFLHHILSIEKGMFQREENILLADPDDDNLLNDEKNEYKLFDVKN